MYKGARHENGDYFDDVMQRQEGIHAGMGMDDYEGIKEQIGKDGLAIKMSCRVCNREHSVTLEWPELFIVGLNGSDQPLRLPNGWAYSSANAACYPNLPCAKCGSPLCPMVTPDEARRHMNTAVSRGFVSQQQVGAWKQHIR